VYETDLGHFSTAGGWEKEEDVYECDKTAVSNLKEALRQVMGIGENTKNRRERMRQKPLSLK